MHHDHGGNNHGNNAARQRDSCHADCLHIRGGLEFPAEEKGDVKRGRIEACKRNITSTGRTVKSKMTNMASSREGSLWIGDLGRQEQDGTLVCHRITD